MDIQKLSEILLELKSASLYVNENPTDENYKNLIHKYDIIFMGENFSTINSLELAHSIKTKFNLQIDNDLLNNLIPHACNLLNMKYEPMISLEDVSNPNPPISCYHISL